MTAASAETSSAATSKTASCHARFAPSANAITTAVAGGYRNLKELALVLKNYQGPGASPCGPCRQVMIEFGRDAIVLQAANKARDVARYVVRDLLPAASGPLRALASLKDSERKRIERVLSVATGAYAPYSKKPRAAIFTATAVNGSRRSFVGVTDDNSAYGGSAAAETIAMRFRTNRRLREATRTDAAGG